MKEALVKVDASLIAKGEKQSESLLSPLSRDIYLFTSKIGGTYRLQDLAPLLSLQVGDALQLRVSQSKYDPNEVAILDEKGQLVGYVPEADETIFRRLMEAGKRLFAKVKSKSVARHVPQIEIDIYLQDF